MQNNHPTSTNLLSILQSLPQIKRDYDVEIIKEEKHTTITVLKKKFKKDLQNQRGQSNLATTSNRFILF